MTVRSCERYSRDSIRGETWTALFVRVFNRLGGTKQQFKDNRKEVHGARVGRAPSAHIVLSARDFRFFSRKTLRLNRPENGTVLAIVKQEPGAFRRHAEGHLAQMGKGGPNLGLFRLAAIEKEETAASGTQQLSALSASLSSLAVAGFDQVIGPIIEKICTPWKWKKKNSH